MSSQPMHLNLLIAQEGQPTPPTLSKILLPAGSALALLAVIGWGIVISIQSAVVGHETNRIRGSISRQKSVCAATAALVAECRGLKAEIGQYNYYLSGRRLRAGILKELATATPPSVTLSSLEIASPDLTQPAAAGTGAPVPPEAAQKTERAELRLIGYAKDEEGVFQLMQALQKSSFTNFLATTDSTPSSGAKNPRVNAFRQENGMGIEKQGGIFFDVVYDLNSREFVK